jgi:hypothetical protein
VALLLILVRDHIGMEGLVMRMLELSFGQPLVIVDRAIANELNLRNTRNSLEVRMKDRFLGVTGLVVSVSIALRFGVKGLTIALV